MNEPVRPAAVPRAADMPPPVASDRRLLEACVAGEPGSRAAFTGRFARLFRHVVDQTAAADGDCPPADRPAVVDAMLAACLDDDAAVLRGFAGRATPETYLAVAAQRLARRLLHRRPPPAAARRPLGREQLEPLLARLEPGEARLVRLHRLEGRSYGEISQLTGLPLAAIGPALARARARLEADDPPRPAGEHAAGQHATSQGGGPTSTDGSARSIG